MDRKRPIKTGFHRSGPVFLSSRIKVDRSRSRSFNFGPKDRTGPDLQTLNPTPTNRPKSARLVTAKATRMRSTTAGKEKMLRLNVGPGKASMSFFMSFSLFSLLI